MVLWGILDVDLVVGTSGVSQDWAIGLLVSV